MKTVFVRILSFAVALPALAGCDPSLDLIHVRAGCPDMPLRGPGEFASAPPDTMIDDFDDGDMLLSKLGGRDGAWAGSLGPTPAPGSTVNLDPSSECVARGTRSAHLTSTATVATYAASWTAVMRAQIPAPQSFDANAYSGFSFWIARGAGAVPPFETPIGVTTEDTAPAFGICESCNDYYAIKTRIPLTTTWTRWFVPFTDLRQYGFGRPLVPLRRDKLVSIIIWPEPQFDIWIDDLRFEP